MPLTVSTIRVELDGLEQALGPMFQRLYEQLRGLIMASNEEVMAKVTEIQSHADAKAAEVISAVRDLRKMVDDARATAPDNAPLMAALDRVETTIDGIDPSKPDTLPGSGGTPGTEAGTSPGNPEPATAPGGTTQAPPTEPATPTEPAPPTEPTPGV
jgi:hypothetical protein